MSQTDEPKPISALIPAVSSKLLTSVSSPATPLSRWRPEIDAYEPSLAEAADACAKYVADMERGAEPYWLTLLGVTGCGKTMLAKQLRDRAIELNPGNPKVNPIWPPDWRESTARIYEGSRPEVRWFEESRFASRMRGGEWDLPEGTRDDFCLVLDDLGFTRDPTNFVSEAMARLAQARLRGWTVWTANKTLSEIAEQMDARIASRLIRDDNKVVVIKATDYALRRRAQ